MRLRPIITSLLDTDFYKFTMGQVIMHQYPSFQVTWTFKCRNKDVYFTDEMIDEIKDQLKYYCTLSFTNDELEFLRRIDFIKGNYIDFLSVYHPRYDHFYIGRASDGSLEIEARGPWFLTTYYEIPVLSIVNEVYFRMTYTGEVYEKLLVEQERRFNAKLEGLANNTYRLNVFSDFGTRRRFSYETQKKIIARLVKASKNNELGNNVFLGTSNVLFAKLNGVKAIGTMAHEFVMAVGQGQHEFNPAYSNKFALESWVKEYGTKNGIYLTDTIGTDNCLLDFDDHYSTVFTGVRHDSGDPLVWAEKMINHYKKYKIDPKTKTFLFSDGLDFPKATKLYDELNNRVRVAFGIGTNITNDTGATPLNIVMKITSVNGQPVAKWSDEPSKTMCKDEEYVEYLKRAINWRNIHSKKEL